MIKTNKKRLCIVISLLAAVVLGICLLPYPTYISRQLTGAGFQADGTKKTSMNIKITGWKLDYLLLKDSCELEFSVNETATDSLLQGQLFIYSYPNGAPFGSVVFTGKDNAAENLYIHSNFTSTADFCTCLLTGGLARRFGVDYIAASESALPELEALLQQFPVMASNN